MANLRGGGEFGRAWHQAGTKDSKQNVFDDCAAVLNDVAHTGLSSPKKIVLEGGSNGGLLVCAMATQFPSKFACGLSHVPVADMLRFHKFTIGYAWVSDYGSADATREEFETLRRYSPLHNVHASHAPWPAMLVLTADHDDRVVPLHSFKFVAEMQHKLGASHYQRTPLLIRIEVNAGHGAGMPLSKQLAATADALVFAGTQTGAQLAAET